MNRARVQSIEQDVPGLWEDWRYCYSASGEREQKRLYSQTDYEPFGTTVAVTGIDTRKKFIDKERDGETGTTNHGVRQYDPEIGRTRRGRSRATRTMPSAV